MSDQSLVPVSSLDDALTAQREKFETQIADLRDEYSARERQRESEILELRTIASAFSKNGTITNEGWKKISQQEYATLRAAAKRGDAAAIKAIGFQPR